MHNVASGGQYWNNKMGHFTHQRSNPIPHFIEMILSRIKDYKQKQPGAELCQAQAQLY